MEIYQKENKDVIQKNKLKLTREQEELEEALEVERQENEQRRLFIQKEEQLQQILKRKNKQAFLDELVCINVNWDKKSLVFRVYLSYLLYWIMTFQWRFYSLCWGIQLLFLYFKKPLSISILFQTRE